ncbi:hypothetical protein HPB50_023678 [Hyalomma asiaticum]|uniref:Uncharacterized protein n=1 Tax=Hyalomma asiaticum TaxID=266040 RepID=A0ACB7T8Y7_HYAAI|nr:hypothetical protein HPB50_023678 [Hyalomma asiaticum]
MDLSKLRKPDLVMLCEEMGIEVAALRRKPLLIQALEDSGADEEELSECWELIQERMKRESEDKERETVRRKEEAEIQIREIERLRLQLQIVEAKCASSAITRSKARELAAERAGEGEQPRAVAPCEQASTSAGEDGSRVCLAITIVQTSVFKSGALQ